IRVREVGLEPLTDTLAAPHFAHHSAETADRLRAREQVEGALRSGIAALPLEDQVVVRMRYWDGFSVAEIARSLGLDQKALYRRLEGIQRRLGDRIRGAGWTGSGIAELLDREGD
ncbi:MAG: RNA polymerase sigma factor, partial [bacterium]